MKLSVNWLREIINPNLTNQQLIAQLTMAGLEVEGIEPACAPFSEVYSALVTKIEPHPDAEKLRVCTVKSHNKDLTIVCGASNVSAGIKVALAVNGAKLQDGKIKIKNSKLRGVQSEGMLCSEQELGLAETSQGITILPDETPLDVSLYDYLNLNDEILEIKLTPNRGDCFSLRGMAREIAVLNNMKFCDPAHKEDVTKTDNSNLNIKVTHPESCPRYVGRVIKNLDATAKTPVWMREKLRRAGIRSTFPLVDVTNYVMLELGQPMHAFDLNSLDGEINIRLATKGEKLELLNGKELQLSSQDLVICDKTKPLALAGIMGGNNSAITAQTQNVFLESAYFLPEAIAKTARSYNIISDSSQRFERGVDPSITKVAVIRATELLLEIASTANTTISSITDITAADGQQSKTIQLREKRIKRILGIEFASQQIETILSSLGLKLANKQQDETNGVIYHWRVPSHRFDLNIEVDLIEELARIHGYNNIPNVSPKRPLAITSAQPQVALAEKIRTTLLNRGYFEAINYSFIDASLQADFAPNEQALKLINPISSEMNELRLSLCPGLIKVAEFNYNHKAEIIKLYEIGKCFYPAANGTVNEKIRLAGILVGNKKSDNWDYKSSSVDFFDAKGDLESLLAALNISKVRFQAISKSEAYPGLHPGRSAEISMGNKVIGWLGELHPEVKNKTNIDDSVILFELSLEELQIPSYTKYEEISKFPQIRRDLAFLFKNELKVQELYDIVAKRTGSLLQNMYIFDLYQGKGIPEGYKSIAFAMILQHKTKTLVDEEIVSLVSEVIKDVTDKLGGKLRE